MKLGIIGCGNMGSALATGILSKKVFPFNNIYVSDTDANKAKELYRKFGTRLSTNEDIAKRCAFIIIAVKPQDSQGLLSSIATHLTSSQHLISIMAGVTLSRLEKLTSKKIAITRAMPNMAALAAKSITCISHNRVVKEKIMVNKIFSSIGEVVEIEEKMMNAVTAISGSGPAYFFYLAEALRDAAVKLGIRREKAIKLAVATLAGTGALLDALDITPEALRERITSKKGTTEAAISVLKSYKFKQIIEQAVKKAAKRAGELSS